MVAYRARDARERLTAYATPRVAAQLRLVALGWTILDRAKVPRVPRLSESETFRRLLEVSLAVALEELASRIEFKGLDFNNDVEATEVELEKRFAATAHDHVVATKK